MRARHLALPALLLSFACHATPDEPVDALLPELAVPDDPASGATDQIVDPLALAVVTYDGSGEMVHPDALVFPHDWHGNRYWFAGTPYPFGDPSFENPSAYAGNEATEWASIPGVANPVARPAASAYLSDPDLSYDPALDQLRLYYRQTTPMVDEVWLRTSRTGSEWSEPTLVLQDVRYGLISPALVREPDGSWRLWSVSAAAAGCRSRVTTAALTQRRSRNGVQWDAPAPVSLLIPGHVAWHLDVQYIRSRSEYWALVAAYPDGSDCSHTAVYFARSSNGTTWTPSPTPLLAPGAIPAMSDLVYRSTFRYFPNSDVVTVWFSGARVEHGRFHYSLATARYPLAELLRRVSASAVIAPAIATVKRGRPDPTDAARQAFIEAFP
ncbi:MAG: hypothetical protein ABJA80_04460 [bacterium]